MKSIYTGVLTWLLSRPRHLGIPLTAELRDMGIPVVNFTPSRGNDKHARVNSVSPLFETGKVWAPMHQHFAQEVVEECAAFRMEITMTMSTP